jgi:SRSO17 transposase
MAARIAPDKVGAKHQSLHHFVAKAPWDEAELLAAVRTFVLPKIEKQAPIRGWIVDDTGIPKKGKHSVAVARQYCGELGKQDNCQVALCQVAVTLSVASNNASLPIALRLYLPETWSNDKARCKKAGVPKDVIFQAKPHIALDQIRQAIEDGVPQGIVLADAGYGNDTAFRSGLTELNLDYVVGIQGSTTVWAPGTEPLPVRAWSGNGRKTKLLRRDDTTKPIKVSALARSLPRKVWKTVRWREGTRVVPLLAESRNDPSSLFFVLLIGKTAYTFPGSTLKAISPPALPRCASAHRIATIGAPSLGRTNGC